VVVCSVRELSKDQDRVTCVVRYRKRRHGRRAALVRGRRVFATTRSHDGRIQRWVLEPRGRLARGRYTVRLGAGGRTARSIVVLVM
jgi:hypothetical protein